MSEEGEADIDVGRASESPPTTLDKATIETPPHERQGAKEPDTSAGAPATTGNPGADAAAGPNIGAPGGDASDTYGGADYRHVEYDARYGGYEGRYPQSPTGPQRHGDGDYGYDHRQSSRSRSRASSRVRDPSRRPLEYSTAYYEGRTVRHREERGDEGEYRSGPYGRGGRYGDRGGDYHSRSAYYRRYEREPPMPPPPRYNRRESGRGSYSRGGYGAREELEGEYPDRRDVDKDRAIEELRSRVRAEADRPADGMMPSIRDRSRSASRLPPAARTDPHFVSRPPGMEAQPSANPLPVAEPMAVEDAANAGPGATAAVIEGGGPDNAQPRPPVNLDDLEEGEHVEGAMDIDLPQEAEFERNRVRPMDRSRSRGRPVRDHSRTRSRSAGRRRDYADRSPYGLEGRRGSGYRDYPDGAYRRRHEDHMERQEYRSRESYGGRSGYSSRYGDGSYPARYSNRRSPEGREGPYRPERSRYSGRYERYENDEPARPSYDEPHDLRPPRSRSRSPPPPPLLRESTRSRAEYEDRYRRVDRSASRGAGGESRSPRRGYSRGPDAVDEANEAARGYRRSRYSEGRWTMSNRHYASPSRRAGGEPAGADGPSVTHSPPPPPPMPRAATVHGSQFGGARGTGSSPYEHDSPHHGYGSRAQAWPPRTPRGGAHGQGPAHAAHPSRYDEGHSRNPSGGGGRSPPPPPPPEQAPAVQGRGTDLFISRYAEADEWLATREQVREQAKRILELAEKTRKTGFELMYSGWGVLKADSQVQLAMWQVDRAEQGLAMDRSAIDSSLGEL
ncbi:hypothetical protein GGF46_001305 [Coemansia sp. RSA 552]|nr:hypothetical protein GGF46_001305 [Coemansia sp. RSA 552]